jgi:glycosyltransferase involved in cell wall biosynthesis
MTQMSRDQAAKSHEPEDAHLVHESARFTQLMTRQGSVLHLIDSGGFYGAERVLLSLAAGCRELGYRVIVGGIVAPQDTSDALGDEARARGLEYVQFRMRDGLNLAGLQSVLRFARRQRVGIIHSHGYKPSILLGLTPKTRLPCPIVCTLHGWTSTSMLSRMSIYMHLERVLLRRFDHVVAVSQSIANSIRRRVLAERLSIIHNGVLLGSSEFTGTHTGRHGFSASNRVARLIGQRMQILAAGRLTYEKGFDLLISAAHILKSKGINFELTIAGEGPLRTTLQSQINTCALSRYVRLVGYCDSMDPYYQDADLFVLCSRTEALPLVVLEAMAWGVPIVSSRVGDIPEVLAHGEFGFLINELTPESIAESIISAMELLSSRNHHGEMTGRALERVSNYYSVASMVDGYSRLYQELVDATG